LPAPLPVPAWHAKRSLKVKPKVNPNLRMNPNLRILKFVVAVLGLILFVADRILKYYFYKNPALVLGGDFFYNLLSFHFVRNFGIAFGLPFFGPILIVLIFLILLFLIGLLVNQIKSDDLLLYAATFIIIIGASSNLIDRLRYGFVIDYIDLTWFTVFNLADCMITIGVFLFLIQSISKKPRTFDKSIKPS